MGKLLVQVERVEDLIGRADNYFRCDLGGKDSVDVTAFAYAEKRKPITNADRIRAMSDEELAADICMLELLLAKHGHRGFHAWLDWLKKEARE